MEKLKHFHSVFYTEQDCLKAILKLHIKKDTFDCDPMFYKGGFYKEIPKPKLISDIRGDELGIPKIDFINDKYLNDNSIDNIILDPPFVIVNRPSQMKSSTTNFSYYSNLQELSNAYEDLLYNAYKALKPKGICVFKCQDYTDSKTLMNHVLVANLASEIGFYLKDIAILVNPKNKPTNNNLNQRHFRKIHTYF